MYVYVNWTLALNAIAIQPDGRLLMGGALWTGSGQQFSPQRLSGAFIQDPAFSPTTSSNVNCLAIQRDGKILVGGAFTNVSGASRSYLCRLNTNGSLDPSFYPTANGAVSTLAVQEDGEILVGGTFTALGGAGAQPNCEA